MSHFLAEGWWLVALVVASLVPLARHVARDGLLPTLRTLDRRWIFLLMLWAVLVPIYYIGVTGQTLPEVPSALAEDTFNEIERLQPGDPVLLAFDYDPPSAGELAPMATAFARHAAASAAGTMPSCDISSATASSISSQRDIFASSLKSESTSFDEYRGIMRAPPSHRERDRCRCT